MPLKVVTIGQVDCIVYLEMMEPCKIIMISTFCREFDEESIGRKTFSFYSEV